MGYTVCCCNFSPASSFNSVHIEILVRVFGVALTLTRLAENDHNHCCHANHFPHMQWRQQHRHKQKPRQSSEKKSDCQRPWRMHLGCTKSMHHLPHSTCRQSWGADRAMAKTSKEPTFTREKPWHEKGVKGTLVCMPQELSMLSSYGEQHVLTAIDLLCEHAILILSPATWAASSLWMLFSYYQ